MQSTNYDINKTDPYVKAVVEKLPPAITEFVVTRESLVQFRALAAMMIPDLPFECAFASREKIDFEVAGQALEIYHYKPNEAKTDGAVYWIHGGGYIQGDAKDDKNVLPFVEELGCSVFSIEYRLAPEHPFPAGHDDCLKGYQWLLENAAQYGVDKNKIAMGGTSAGGGMSAGLTLKMRDKGIALPVCQLLKAPMIDNLCETPSSNIKGLPIWKSETNKNAWEMYLNGTPGKDASPYAAASRATILSNLPPTLITVGSQDAFVDENKAFIERLKNAGGEGNCEVFQGVIHGADAIANDAEIVKQMEKSNLDFLKTYIN